MSYEKAKEYFASVELEARTEHADPFGWVDVCKGWYVNAHE